MDKNERTRDVFEQIPAYSKPPLIPVSDPDDFSELFEGFRIKDHPVSVKIIKAAGIITGLRRFHRTLPDSLENILRKTNVRTPGLFSPVISATLALKDDERNPDPIERAVTLILSARSFYSDIISGKLAPDSLKGQILEMGEYPNLFSTNMIIEGRRVRVFKTNINTKLILASEGRFYTLALSKPEEDIPFMQLYETISAIVKQCKTDRNSTPSVGILTAAPYGTQINAFRSMKKDPHNKPLLDEFKHSFFTLCLDLESCPETYEEAARLAHCGNYPNRWYHSSIQIVIFGNSKACVICNFTTYLDGNVMMRAGAELQSRAENQPIEKNRSGLSDLLHVKEVNLKCDEKYIRQAQLDLKNIEDKQQSTFEIKDYGTDFFDNYNLNPVPAFIIALQMAIKNLTGKMIDITQFLSMSKYRCMDLITVRVTTPEVRKFIEYAEQNQNDLHMATSLLNDAVDSQIRKCRTARQSLAMSDVLSLFMRSKSLPSRLYVIFVMFLVSKVLKMMKLIDLKKSGYQVIVSHPEIYPEVEIVGRPGVRLPYAKYFGLHYQIWKDRIVLTFMPALDLKLTNEQITSEINKCLHKIQSLLDNSRVITLADIK